jgi:hypothetical protein
LLSDKSQVVSVEVAQIWEDSWKVGIADPKPPSQSCGVLIECRCGNPAAVATGVIGSGKHQCGESSIDSVALNGAALDQLMAAPVVVGPRIGAGLKSAAEFGKSEGGHFVGNA